MLISDIQPNHTVELNVIGQKRSYTFPSKVVQRKDNSIFINKIMLNGKTIGFPASNQINSDSTDSTDTSSLKPSARVQFLYHDGELLYLWDYVSVKLIRYEGNRIYHMVSLFGDGIKYNRRNAFRLYVGEQASIKINSPEGSSNLSVLLKDISETGAGFISKEDLNVTRTIKLTLSNSAPLIRLSGSIVRKEFNPSLNSYVYGCRFIEPNKLLPYYIMKKQREKVVVQRS